MSMTCWEELYKMAVLETDWSKMEDRIRAAHAAMDERLHQFSMNSGGTPKENRAIADALSSFKILRADLASWRKSQQASRASSRQEAAFVRPAQKSMIANRRSA